MKINCNFAASVRGEIRAVETAFVAIRNCPKNLANSQAEPMNKANVRAFCMGVTYLVLLGMREPLGHGWEHVPCFFYAEWRRAEV